MSHPGGTALGPQSSGCVGDLAASVLQRSWDLQWAQRAAVWPSIGRPQLHELPVGLAQVEFNRAEVMRVLVVEAALRVLAMCVRHKRARSNVVKVVGEALVARHVQILVVVLGEIPVALSPAAVVLAIRRLDLDRERPAGSLEDEFEHAPIAAATEIVNPNIAPGVEKVNNPIATPAKLAICERAKTRRAAQDPRPISAVRLEADEPRRVFNHSWRRCFEPEKPDDGLAGDPIRSLGKAHGREAIFVNVVEDRGTGHRRQLGDFAWRVESLWKELKKLPRGRIRQCHCLSPLVRSAQCDFVLMSIAHYEEYDQLVNSVE
jgi:hypothetical protein